MKSKSLGCVNAAGLIATGLTLVMIAIISLVRGGVMFSPGELNAQTGTLLGGFRSHAEFNGQCSLCHAPFWDTAGMSGRCEDCHSTISIERVNPTTLHGAIFQHNPGQTCQDCHTDHHGAEASLTKVTDINFPHDVVGFSLLGHISLPDVSPFKCADCHGDDLTSFYPTTCQICHQDIDQDFMNTHLLTFGSSCLKCHDGVDRYGDDFDHNLFIFALTGAHASVACIECHPDAHSITDLRTTPQECFACHNEDDIHQGSLGGDCGACHTTTGWKPALFDHNLSAFPLTGKHEDVACESCHTENILAGTPTDCFSCHKTNDIHGGQYGTDCAFCHTTSGWRPATFDHNLSGFPLTGTHASLTCTRCHIGGNFSGLSSVCGACHVNPAFHAGLFGGMTCNSCHNTTSWLPASFSLSHPNICDGNCIGHGGATCRTCHTTNLNTATCTACHENNNPGDDD